MSEKYLGEVSTPLLINQIKENCAQKRTALPIPSIDELGNTYQYMGTTSGSLVHGYFYECVSDGQDPATYSWQQVNIQPTAGTPTAATTTFDNTTSGLQATNVQDAIDEVVDGLGTAASKDFTPNVAPNNHNLVESNAVYNAITTALTSIYTPRGDLTCAELTSALLVAANVGNIYEMSDSGTTSALFLQGAGQTIHVGDNVGIIQTGVDTYKFNLMANAFDMTDYQKKDLSQAVEGATTVEGALGVLSTNNQATQAEVNDIVNILGAKNLFNTELGARVSQGITYTRNDDGSITANGTATEDSWNVLCEYKTLKAGKYILSGCPSGGSGSTYFMYTEGGITNYDYGNGKTFTLDSDTSIRFGICVRNGQSLSNLKFYPMIRLATITDDTYEPYAKGNQELTKDDNGLIANAFINGAVNLLPNTATTQVYHGVTFTVNSNGIIQTSGTATDSGGQFIVSRFYLPNGFYKLSGGINTNRPLVLAHAKGDVDAVDRGDGVIFEADSSLQLAVYIGTSGDMSGLTYKPMITVVDMPNSDSNHYVSYAMTNKQITDAMPLNVDTSNKLIPSLSRIITPTESTANPDLLNTLTGGNVKFAWGAIKLQNDAPHTIDNEVYVISYAESNISQVGNTAVIAQIAIARSGSGYDSSIYKRFYCYHGGTYKWSPWEKLVTESDIAITTLGTPSEVFSSVESGYSINDCAMYKQGKHVWGTFVLSKDSGDLPSSQATVATLKFIPSASMNSWCVCSGNRYGGQPFYIGYMWAASGNGQILVCNPSGTTSGVNTAKIMLDYCID